MPSKYRIFFSLHCKFLNIQRFVVHIQTRAFKTLAHKCTARVRLFSVRSLNRKRSCDGTWKTLIRGTSAAEEGHADRNETHKYAIILDRDECGAVQLFAHKGNTNERRVFVDVPRFMSQ